MNCGVWPRKRYRYEEKRRTAQDDYAKWPGSVNSFKNHVVSNAVVFVTGKPKPAVSLLSSSNFLVFRPPAAFMANIRMWRRRSLGNVIGILL